MKLYAIFLGLVFAGVMVLGAVTGDAEPKGGGSTTVSTTASTYPSVACDALRQAARNNPDRAHGIARQMKEYGCP